MTINFLRDRRVPARTRTVLPEPFGPAAGLVDGVFSGVDLGAVPGLIAFGGRRPAAVRAVTDIVEQVGRDPAADRVTITVLGELPGLALPASRVHRVSSLDDRLDEDAENAANSRPHRQLIVVTTELSQARMALLRRYAERADGSAAVIVVGDVPDAAYHCDVARVDDFPAAMFWLAA